MASIPEKYTITHFAGGGMLDYFASTFSSSCSVPIWKYIFVTKKQQKQNKKLVPPADTAALFCLAFTNARVVSTIILFRCGRLAPTYFKRLGLKHATVHFRNTVIGNTQYVRVRSRVRIYKALLYA